MNTTITHINPNNLKNHPLNKELYRDDSDQDFIDSCRKGILNPLLVTEDNRVISGHRRLQAARILELKSIPCVVKRHLDELDIEEALIFSNKQREKTTEEKAREFKRLELIEKKRAANRQKTGKKHNPDLRQNFAQGQKSGKARDAAAEKVGMSGESARKASKVVNTIDELIEEGKTEEAEELRQDLNTSVHKAHQKVLPVRADIKGILHPCTKQ